MPKISVVVPVYNAESFVEDAVQSIKNQTFKDIEIILVNDGSSDRSGKICDKLANSDPLIKVIHQKNAGVSAARNRGIDAAIGEYIGFMDVDDVIESDMYEFLFSEIREIGADMSMCGIMIKQLNGVIKLEYGTERRFVFNSNDAIDAFLKGSIFNVSMNTKLIKREVLKNCRFDENIKINEDKLMLFQCITNVDKIVCNDVCKYIYIKRDRSTSEERFSSKFFDIISVAYKIKETVKLQLPNHIKQAEKNYFLSNLYVYRMLSRKKQYIGFRSEYLTLKKFILEEDYSSFKTLLSINKRIEVLTIRKIPFMYTTLLRAYDFLLNRSLSI